MRTKSLINKIILPITCSISAIPLIGVTSCAGKTVKINNWSWISSENMFMSNSYSISKDNKYVYEISIGEWEHSPMDYIVLATSGDEGSPSIKSISATLGSFSLLCDARVGIGAAIYMPTSYSYYSTLSINIEYNGNINNCYTGLVGYLK